MHIHQIIYSIKGCPAKEKNLQWIRNLGCKSKVSYHSCHLTVLFILLDENILETYHYEQVRQNYTLPVVIGVVTMT
jgi:hypothetical protein